MSLDRNKLQMLRELAGGGWQARCPACAESGQDRKGEHLRVAVDGKFGCCVFPGDREHRKRIFALAGDHGPKAITVRVPSAKTAEPLPLDLSAFAKAASKDLGRWGQVLGSSAGSSNDSMDNSGTLGTSVSNPRAYANEPVNDDLYMEDLIGSQEPVPSVPEEKDGTHTKDTSDQKDNGERTMVRLPYLLADGTLVIPFIELIGIWFLASNCTERSAGEGELVFGSPSIGSPAVDVVQVDVLPPVATAHHVVYRSRVLDPQLPRQVGTFN